MLIQIQSISSDAPKYTPDYFRATWIVTGLDAGFATAMSIRPKWVRDICSLIFAMYYILFPSAADEKARYCIVILASQND